VEGQQDAALHRENRFEPAFRGAPTVSWNRSGDRHKMRILLASLEGFIAGDIAVVLGGQSCTFVRADSEDDAQQMVKHHHFDVILFGAGPAGATGVDFIRRLRAAGSQLPAVAVSRLLDGRGRGRLLDAGADDVIEVPCDTTELCARLRAVVRRTRGFTRSVLTVGPLELHMDSRSAAAHGRDLHLSPSEFKVLELLILRKSTVVNKTALMDLLYGELDEPDVKSLNVLMHRLRKRLSLVGLDGFVRTVWGTGYMVDEPARAIPPVRVDNFEREMAYAD